MNIFQRLNTAGFCLCLIFLSTSCNNNRISKNQKQIIADSIKKAVVDSINRIETKKEVDTIPQKVIIIEKEAIYKYKQLEKCADYWIAIDDRKVFLSKEEALNYYGEMGWRYVDTQTTEKGEKITLEQKILK